MQQTFHHTAHKQVNVVPMSVHGVVVHISLQRYTFQSLIVSLHAQHSLVKQAKFSHIFFWYEHGQVVPVFHFVAATDNTVIHDCQYTLFMC